MPAPKSTCKAPSSCRRCCRRYGFETTKRTKSGSYTTNAAALQDLYVKSVDNERANGFLGALLRHREINKLKQIVQTLIDATNTSDERIHTTFRSKPVAANRAEFELPELKRGFYAKYKGTVPKVLV